MWAGGFFVPIVPTFGFPSYGYDGTVGKKKAVSVTIALFNKAEAPLQTNPCEVLLSSSAKLIKPVSYSISYLQEEAKIFCGSELNKPVLIDGKGKDVAEMEIVYPATVVPEAHSRVVLPELIQGTKVLKLEEFQFEKGRSFECGGVI